MGRAAGPPHGWWLADPGSRQIVKDKPPTSAISLFTAVGTGVILVLGVAGLVLRHASLGWWLLWCVALVVVTGLNAWAYWRTR